MGQAKIVFLDEVGAGVAEDVVDISLDEHPEEVVRHGTGYIGHGPILSRQGQRRLRLEMRSGKSPGGGTCAVKHPPFNYHRPTTVDEALRLLDEHGAEAKILAGGQSLLPVMALRLGRPDHVIDIGGIDELGQITAGSTGGVRIGAMVRHAQAENSPEVGATAPLVTAALPHVGHRAIRSRGTVVGSIVHADAAAEMPAVCLAGAATLHVASTQGERTVAAADFFEGFFQSF